MIPICSRWHYTNDVSKTKKCWKWESRREERLSKPLQKDVNKSEAVEGITCNDELLSQCHWLRKSPVFWWLGSWHCIVQFMFLKWNGLLCAQTPSFTFSVWESISAVDCGCCELRQSLPHSTRAPVCFGMHCPRCTAHCVEHAQTLHNTLVSHFSQALFVTHWTSCIFSHCLVSHLNRKCKSTWSLCGHHFVITLYFGLH